MRPESLGVIGLGAIGGSLAWRAVEAGVGRVVGYSPIPAEAVAALKAGAITEIAERPDRALNRTDLVVLAAPPAATLRLLGRLAGELRRRGVLCTDVASVKRPVIQQAERLGLGPSFAGSHPLAGTHRSGFAAARASLLQRAVVYVTPAAGGEQAAQEIADFWRRICDAEPVLLDAARHDRLVAWTSHLAQAVASSLAAAVARQGPKAVSFGSGMRDTTRLAASDETLWHDILLLNREAVLEALDAVDDELGRLRRALATADGKELQAWLALARRWREALER